MTQQTNGHRPYTRGWRAPWRGQWGPIDDGHSRLGRLARRIERELFESYDATAPLARRRVRQAARLSALAEATLTSIGRDPEATRRSATALQAAADRQLAALETLAARNDHRARVPTPAELLERIAEASRG